MRRITPQAEKVLKHLVTTGSITNVEANAVLKCRSVSRRITEIKDELGTIINKEFRKDSTGQRYVRYSMTRNERALENFLHFNGALELR